MATPQTVAFHTLGCKLNFSETSSIRRKFESLGYGTVDWDHPADVYVLNTCSVTEFADKKCRAAVRKALRQRPDAKIVVVGCYAQLKPDEIAEIEGVDLVLGAAEKFNVHEYIEGISKSAEKGMIRTGQIREVSSFQDAFSFGDRTRTFLKIQDGCDYKCTFCTIPLARGSSRSSSIENILDNVHAIAAQGVQEVVLTGVNIGDFGKIPGSQNQQDNKSFLDLIRELDQIKEISRFRISSIEPNLCSDKIIDFVAQSNKFVPHFHMPLQSGSDKILRMMRRRYRRNLYLDRVSKIKSQMPHACIGLDVIVGFPGESESDFQETFDFISDLDISYLHVFTFSERANTIAAKMDIQVPMEIRRARNKTLRELSEKKKFQFYFQHLEQVRPVLLEKSNKTGRLTGYTDNYIKVDIPYPTENEAINHIVPVRLEKLQDNGVVCGNPIFFEPIAS